MNQVASISLCRVEQRSAHRTHNPKVTGSNPVSATNFVAPPLSLTGGKGRESALMPSRLVIICLRSQLFFAARKPPRGRWRASPFGSGFTSFPKYAVLEGKEAKLEPLGETRQRTRVGQAQSADAPVSENTAKLEPLGETRQRTRVGQAQSAGAPVSENTAKLEPPGETRQRTRVGQVRSTGAPVSANIISPFCYLSGVYHEFSCYLQIDPDYSCASERPSRSPLHRRLDHVWSKVGPCLVQNKIHRLYPHPFSPGGRISSGVADRHSGHHLQKAHQRRNQTKRRSSVGLSGAVWPGTFMRRHGRQRTAMGGKRAP